MPKASVPRLPETDAEVEVERRRSDRAEVLVRVDYRTVDELFSDFARNVNEGGLFVETESPLAIDTPVSVQFKIPGSDEPVSGSGRVVRTQSDTATETPGMAIEFDELNTESRRRINELVRGLRIGHRA